MMASTNFPMLPPKPAKPAPKKRARGAVPDLSARLKAAGKPKKPAYPFNHGDGEGGAC